MSDTDSNSPSCLTWIIIFFAFVFAFNRINDLEDDVKELKMYQHKQINVDSLLLDTISPNIYIL